MVCVRREGVRRVCRREDMEEGNIEAGCVCGG